MPKISFFAHDLGPARNLVFLAAEALNRGHRIVFVGNRDAGKCLDLADCEILVTGLSSFQNEEELQMGAAAVSNGIPWLVLADTHLAWGRAAARGRVSSAIAIVASAAEIEMARKFGYKDAVYLGGPPLWKTFSGIIAAESQRIPGMKVILVGGIKSMGITNDFLAAVVAAMGELSVPWRLIFKPHPNEKKTPEEEKRRARILEDADILERPESADRLLGSVDLSIHACGATAAITAAYLRLPVIYFENEEVRQRLREVTGSADWFPATAGACNLATPGTMAREIKKLLFDKEERLKLEERQAEVYPATEGELPEKQFMDFVASLLQ